MGAFEKVLQGIADTIKVNDKIISLSEKIKDLADDVRDIDGRVIRLETFLEIIEKQKYFNDNQKIPKKTKRTPELISE